MERQAREGECAILQLYMASQIGDHSFWSIVRLSFCGFAQGFDLVLRFGMGDLTGIDAEVTRSVEHVVQRDCSSPWFLMRSTRPRRSLRLFRINKTKAQHGFHGWAWIGRIKRISEFFFDLSVRSVPSVKSVLRFASSSIYAALAPSAQGSSTTLVQWSCLSRNIL